MDPGFLEQLISLPFDLLGLLIYFILNGLWLIFNVGAGG